MKLLDIFNDAFEQLPKDGNIRKFLHEQKLKMGGEDFYRVAAHAEGAARKGGVVALVL